MSHRRVDGRGQYGKEYGNSLVRRRTDEEGRAASLRELIRRCQGLAEGWPWQPPKDPLQEHTGDVYNIRETTGE